ncbi:MAG: MFS transporter [Anaerolineae bacterium]
MRRPAPLGLRSRLRRYSLLVTHDRPWLGPFLAYLVLVFLGDLASSPGRSLVSVYAEADLGRPPQFTSLLLSGQMICGAVAAFTGGGLADALGHKRVTVLGATALPLLGLAFLIRQPWLLVVVWMYVGFGIGLYSIGRQSYMMSLVPGPLLGTATALAFTGNTMGAAVGNSIAAGIIDNRGFGALGILTAAVAAVVLVALALATPSAKPAAQVLLPRSSFGGYGAIIRRPVVRLICAMRFFAVGYWATHTLLIPLLLYRASGRPSVAAYYVTVSFAFASICQLGAGRLLDRYGRTGPTVLMTAGLGLISIVTGFYADSLAGLYVCGVLGAGIAWALATATPALITSMSPTEEHGRTLGLTQVATFIGSVFGTQIGGWLVGAHSGLPFLIIGTLNLAMVGSAIALRRRLALPPAEAAVAPAAPQ